VPNISVAADWLSDLAAVQHKPASTIMNYKSSMRTWFVERYIMNETIKNPFDSVLVEKTLTGIQKEDAKQQRLRSASTERTASMTPSLTMDLLTSLKPALLPRPATSFERMRWAAIRLGVTGLLRPNEFVGAYRNRERALQTKQVKFYVGAGIPCEREAQQPSYLQLTMHDTKADPYGRNPPRRIDDEETVQVMWKWYHERQRLSHTPTTLNKFFAWSGHTLSGMQIIRSLNDAAAMHGWYNARFTLKCFRRGGASTLVAAGASTQQIMKAGAWKSEAMVNLYADAESKCMAANKRMNALRLITHNVQSTATAAAAIK
jgi:hypothetical protein